MRPHRVQIDEAPCKKLGYCPYGYLVEGFPLEEPRGEKSCPVYGHTCPVFYAAEAVDVPEMPVTCSLCGNKSRLTTDWHIEGHYHICPGCISGILEEAGQALRRLKRAPDSVIWAAAINLMDEEGLLVSHPPVHEDEYLYVHAPIHELKYNWKEVIASAPAEVRKTNAVAILMSAGIEPVTVEGDTVVLSFRYTHHKLMMEMPENRGIAEQIISSYMGQPYHVSWRQSIN